MRISDGSSDVCSSDLAVGAAAAVALGDGGVELVVGAEEPRHVALEQRAGVALVAVGKRAVDDRRPQPGGLLDAGFGLVAEVAEAAGEVQVVGRDRKSVV